MSKTAVLFLCPHAAAKSVLAMTYFKDLAAKAGLSVSVENAGTEPDPAVNPKVEQQLKNEGFELPNFTPTLLTKEHLTKADIVVSMGCISVNQVAEGTQFIDWSDVPMLSDGFQESRDSIYRHVVAFVENIRG